MVVATLFWNALWYPGMSVMRLWTALVLGNHPICPWLSGAKCRGAETIGGQTKFAAPLGLLNVPKPGAIGGMLYCIPNPSTEPTPDGGAHIAELMNPPVLKLPGTGDA